MKRFFLSLLMVAMITVLAGCISIPLGDDVLEISGDGVKFYKGGKDDAASEDEDVDLDDETDADDDADLEGDNEEDETDAEDSDAGDGGTTQGTSTTQSATCPQDINTDYSRLEKSLVHDFYLPECADLGRINVSGDHVDFDFKVHGGEFEAIFDEYLDSFDEINKQEIDPSWQLGWGRVDANLVNDAGEVSGAVVNIEQKEEHVDVNVRYYLPVEEEEDEG